MKQSEENRQHRSTARVLDILELVAANPSTCTQADICRMLEVPKSSLFPILHTLTDRHFLELDERSRYRIGSAAWAVGASCLSRLNLMDEAEKILRNITSGCKETSHFAVLSGGDVLYLKKVDSPQPIRMTSQVGVRLPAYATALGKALLMDYEVSQLKELYQNHLEALTPHTITDFQTLEIQLQEAQRQGYTFEVEESTPYIRCFAVPVRKAGRVAAAVSVAVPVFRYTEDKGARILELLSGARTRLEELLNTGGMDLPSFVS